MDLVAKLSLYYPAGGLFELEYRMATEALGRQGAQEPSLARSCLLNVAGAAAVSLGHYQQARSHFEEGAAIARRAGVPKKHLGTSLVWLGIVLSAQGEHAGAKQHLTEAVALLRLVECETARLAGALNALGELSRSDGDMQRAKAIYEESLTLNREIGHASAIASNLCNLASVCICCGSPDRAREMLLEGFKIGVGSGIKRTLLSVIDVSAALAAYQSQWVQAARFFGVAAIVIERMGYRRWPGDLAFIAPHIHNARTSLGDSGYFAAEAAGRSLSEDEFVVEIRAWLEKESSTSSPEA
jgi:tetratricopeptide (TPR) repeat protein